MRSQICQIKGVGRLSSMCSCAPWAQNGLAIHHVITFFVADRRNQPTPTLPERSRIKSVHTLLEERSEVRFDSGTLFPAGRSHGTLSWTRGKWRTTNKRQRSLYGSSWRIWRVIQSSGWTRNRAAWASQIQALPTGLQHLERERPELTCQNSAMGKRAYVRTCTCACIVLQNTPSHHIRKSICAQVIFCHFSQV